MTTEMLEPITEQTYYLNMGPQHPSTHGVLRLFLKLDGEYIVEADPVIGYGHRGHEKMAESHLYEQFLPNSSRMDYLSGLLFNHGYVAAVEKMAGIKVPPRAEYIRVICAELNRISSHLLWFGTYIMDLGGFTPFLYCFDDRENLLDILDHVSGSRLTYSYCRFGGVHGVGLGTDVLPLPDEGFDLILREPTRVRQLLTDLSVVLQVRQVLRRREDGQKKRIPFRGFPNLRHLDSIRASVQELEVLHDPVPMGQLPFSSHLKAEELLRRGNVLSGGLARGEEYEGEGKDER